jgi:ApbE superfamily uncharacterized protein (UPF0280 family)
MKKKGYQPRTYRSLCNGNNMVNFNVIVGESDLLIRADHDVHSEVHKILNLLRHDIESYIKIDNSFLTSLEPLSVPIKAPEVVKSMAQAGNAFGVGPMAAVAGAIAEGVARDLHKLSKNVVVENGGDVYLFSERPITGAVYAGNSPLSMKLGVALKPCPGGISICTSSGTVGHSLSFGYADSVSVISESGSMADAAATAICNIVRSDKDLEQAVDFARKFKQIIGLVIIFKNRLTVFGERIKLVEI